MRATRLYIAWAALVALGWQSSALASNGSIDIFADRNGTACSKTMAVFDSIYVMARLGGATSGGITEASFRIEGFPSSWLELGITPNPQATFWVGSPLSSMGVLIAIPPCQSGDPNGLVLLMAIGIFVPPGSPAVQDARLTVGEYRWPPPAATPELYVCNEDFTRYAALGGQFILNPVLLSCTIGVEPASWSGVKSLFREP